MVAVVVISGQACQEKNQEQSKNQVETTTKEKEMEKISTKEFKTFKVSDNVTLYRVTFKNQYKLDVVEHLFIPNNFAQNEKHPAIIVGHPMGAVKEQSADVYASNMADRGFIVLPTRV